MTDADNPLPEPSFGWRRGVTIFGGLIIAVMVAAIVWKLTDAGSLRDIALALIALHALALVLYMVGASAADLALIVQSASMVKRRVRATPDSFEIGGSPEGAPEPPTSDPTDR